MDSLSIYNPGNDKGQNLSGYLDRAMSLADELLADLEEIAEEGDIEDDAENKENGEGLDEGQEDLMDLDAIDTDSIRSIAKLSDSQQVRVLNLRTSHVLVRVGRSHRLCSLVDTGIS